MDQFLKNFQWKFVLRELEEFYETKDECNENFAKTCCIVKILIHESSSNHICARSRAIMRKNVEQIYMYWRKRREWLNCIYLRALVKHEFKEDHNIDVEKILKKSVICYHEKYVYIAFANFDEFILLTLYFI